MLVLRRKAGEAIVLNGVITIYVLAVEGERVKLGISAPPDVVIVRSELLEGPGAGAMGGPMGGPMSGPLGPLAPGGSGSYPRPPRPPLPPDRPWREPERPWREPDGRPRPPAPPGPPLTPPLTPPLGRRESDDPGDSYSGPSRYTPRSRYDTYTPYTSVREERRDDREDAPHPDSDLDEDR